MDLSLKSGRQMCPHCNERLYQLRAELNSKIFLKRTLGSSMKSGSKKQPLLSKRVQVRAHEDMQDDAEVPDDMEKAMDGQVIEIDVDEEKEKEREEEEKRSTIGNSDQIYLTPFEVQKHLRQLLENERETLMHWLGKNVDDADLAQSEITEMFFFECVAVPPSKFRPISTLKDQKFENARTTQLSKLLQDNMVLKEALADVVKDADGGDGSSGGGDDAESSKLQSQTTLESISSNFLLNKYFIMRIIA